MNVAPFNAKLTIADPTQRTDGSALAGTDIDHIDVYRAAGAASPVLLGHVDRSASPGVFLDPGLVAANYGYSVVTTDKFGQASAHSDIFPLVVVAMPAAPDSGTIVSIDPAG